MGIVDTGLSTNSINLCINVNNIDRRDSIKSDT